MQVYKCWWCSVHLSEPGDLRQPRSDKKFCCAAHRAKYSRWLAALHREQKALDAAIWRISKYLDHPMAREDAIHYLVDGKQKIEFNLRGAGVKAVR